MKPLRGFARLSLSTGSGVEAQASPRPGIAAWDSGDASASPLAADALEQKAGWRKLDAAPKAGELKGDLIVTNGRLLLVVRRKGSGVELYSLKSGKPIYRSALLPASGGGIESISLPELGRGAALLEVAWKGAAARFRLPRGETFVESEALSGDVTLRIECPGRFVLMPDFFADDILVDARKLPLDKVEMPSENFILHFAGAHDAIVMGVFENLDQDLRVTLGVKGTGRLIPGSEATYG